MLSRRQLLGGAAGLAAVRPEGGREPAEAVAEAADGPSASVRVPVIDITDLYHPHQDVGDNVDLIAAYGLPEVDLRAVVLDVTNRYRRPYRDPVQPEYSDPTGPRDAGFIPVTQLNAIFGRNVPCAVGPYEAMVSPTDPMSDAPAFQQSGVELMLKALRESRAPVEIVSFGSARPLAVAYNRAPDLVRRKVRMVHLCAGAYPGGYLEWNVRLDVNAFVRVLRSDLPVAIYPCATEKGPFDLGRHNSFWLLPDLEFIQRMDVRLQRYLAFAFERTVRVDFLNAMEEDVPPEVIRRICARPHNVWETAVWANVARRKLVRRSDGLRRLVPAHEVARDDVELPNDLRPCRVSVDDGGRFTAGWDTKGPMRLYDRGDARANERALREALPALYASIRPQARVVGSAPSSAVDGVSTAERQVTGAER